jgi:hypothetical protein
MLARKFAGASRGSSLGLHAEVSCVRCSAEAWSFWNMWLSVHVLQQFGGYLLRIWNEQTLHSRWFIDEPEFFIYILQQLADLTLAHNEVDLTKFKELVDLKGRWVLILR